MEAAIAQLLVVQRGFLGALLGDVTDAGEFLPLVLVLLDLLFDDLGGFAVLVQVGVERLLEELADEFLDRRTLRSDRRGAELGLGLRLEDRLLHAHDDGGVDGLTNIRGVVVFLEMIADGGDERLAKCGEVRAAHGGVLAIDEGPVFLAVVVAVGERDLDVLALEMDDRDRAARRLSSLVSRSFSPCSDLKRWPLSVSVSPRLRNA